jgi:hypothetical protein
MIVFAVMTDAKRDMLRHTLATVAYRGRKAVDNAPESFATFRSSDSSRTPAEILAHVGDLFDWALSLARGEQKWQNSAPLPWTQELARFFDALSAFDAWLASDQPIDASPEQLFQGPVADALTHIGQIALLRRLAGAPIRGENYFVADITAGRVGLDQAMPRREF